MAIREKIPSLEKITIIPNSASDTIEKSASTNTNALRYIQWRQSAFRFIEIDKLNKINIVW